MKLFQSHIYIYIVSNTFKQVLIYKTLVLWNMCRVYIYSLELRLNMDKYITRFCQLIVMYHSPYVTARKSVSRAYCGISRFHAAAPLSHDCVDWIYRSQLSLIRLKLPPVWNSPVCQMLAYTHVCINYDGKTHRSFCVCASQWETSSQCNVTSLWLSAYKYCSLQSKPMPFESFIMSNIQGFFKTVTICVEKFKQETHSLSIIVKASIVCVSD